MLNRGSWMIAQEILDPNLYSYVFMRSKGLDVIVMRKTMGDLSLKATLVEKGDFLMLELRRSIEWSIGLGSSKMVSNMVNAYRSNEREIKVFLDRIGETEGVAHVFNLFTMGTENGFLKKRSIDRSDPEKGSAGSRHPDLNLNQLNMLLGRRGPGMINEITTDKSNAYLYVLGEEKDLELSGFPRDMVLEMDLSGKVSDWFYQELHLHLGDKAPYMNRDLGQMGVEKRKHSYRINMHTLKESMVEIFLLQSRIHSQLLGEISDIKIKGSFLKEEMYSLHNRINTHMSSPEKKGSGRAEKSDSFRKEQDLFTLASQKFSLSSEVEHELMRGRSRLKYHLSFLTRKLEDLHTRTVHLDVSGYDSDYMDSVLSSVNLELEGLKEISEELSQSRNILYYNIDILRGFIESGQRERSEKLSRMMNLLFLLFACIGLADAAGNFVIFLLQFGALSDDPTFMEVLLYSIGGLIFTVIPLSIGAFFLFKAFNRS